MKNSEEKKRTTVYLRKDLYQALKTKAEKTGATRSELINQAVESMLLELNTDHESLLSGIERIRDTHTGFTAMNRLSRDEVHERKNIASFKA